MLWERTRLTKATWVYLRKLCKQQTVWGCVDEPHSCHSCTQNKHSVISCLDSSDRCLKAPDKNKKATTKPLNVQSIWEQSDTDLLTFILCHYSDHLRGHGAVKSFHKGNTYRHTLSVDSWCWHYYITVVGWLTSPAYLSPYSRLYVPSCFFIWIVSLCAVWAYT